MTIFCCRCRTAVAALDVRHRTTANGRRQAVGRCPACDGAVYKFLKDAPAPLGVGVGGGVSQ